MIIPYGDDGKKTLPLATVLLIIINTYVYMSFNYTFEMSWEGYFAYKNFIQDSAMYPLIISFENILTSMFVHIGIGFWGILAHLFGNMLYLWVLGRAVETRLGSFKFLFLYVVSGFLAAIFMTLILPIEDRTTPCIGASGAISGLIGAYVLLFPLNHIKLFYWFGIFGGWVAVPAWLAIGAWYTTQLIPMYLGYQSGIAYTAHVGGFVSGIVLTYLLARKEKQ